MGFVQRQNKYIKLFVLTWWKTWASPSDISGVLGLIINPRCHYATRSNTVNTITINYCYCYCIFFVELLRKLLLFYRRIWRCHIISSWMHNPLTLWMAGLCSFPAHVALFRAAGHLRLRLLEDLGGRASPGEGCCWSSKGHRKGQESARWNKQRNGWNENDRRGSDQKSWCKPKGGQ